MTEWLESIRTNVIQGRLHPEDEGFEESLHGEPGVMDRVKGALEAGVPVREILTGGLFAGLEEVGRRFEAGKYYLPEMLVSADAVTEVMKLLEPHIQRENIQKRGTVVMATV
ncbi:MAG: cobalamin B12-binding domain-containing protein, partial [Planctomycetota bacterium]